MTDRIGGIVRALVGVPQKRLPVLQSVVNGLNSAAQHGDQFQVELSKFVVSWKPVSMAAVSTLSPDLLRWEANYEKLFGYKPNLSELVIPEKPEGVGAVRLIVVVKEIVGWTENHPLQGTQETLKKHFTCWQYADDFDKSVSTNDRDPRKGSYAVWVKDVREADEENANKSADDLKAESHTGITTLERQLLEADYFFEKGEHLDLQNVTLCTGSRDRDGRVPYARWFGEFRVRWCHSTDRDPPLRSRRVWA